jgi:hypothetical protein
VNPRKIVTIVEATLTPRLRRRSATSAKVSVTRAEKRNEFAVGPTVSFTEAIVSSESHSGSTHLREDAVHE